MYDPLYTEINSIPMFKEKLYQTHEAQQKHFTIIV